MKNIARIASASLALMAGQAFAGECYIHANVLSDAPKARVVLDVMRVDIPYYTSDNLRMQLNQPESDNLKARAIAFVKKNAKRIEGAGAAATYDKAALSYGSSCFRDEIRAEEMRGIDARNTPVLHGSWSLEKVTPVSAKDSAAAVATARAANASRSASSTGPLLTRSVDSGKPTPEQVAEQKKRDAARKKTEDTAAAAAKSKAATDAANFKVADDKRRQVCMRPEHRGDCGCSKYFPPDPKQTVCSK